MWLKEGGVEHPLSDIELSVNCTYPTGVTKIIKFIAITIIGSVLAINAYAGTVAGKRAFAQQNYGVALKELGPAAKKGDRDAMFMLAQMHGSGFGVTKNMNKAVKLYGKAADLGHVDAQKEYGSALALGDGIEKNAEEGLKWLMIASQEGNSGALAFAKRFAKYFPRTAISTARRKAFKWRQEFKKNSQPGG